MFLPSIITYLADEDIIHLQTSGCVRRCLARVERRVYFHRHKQPADARRTDAWTGITMTGPVINTFLLLYTLASMSESMVLEAAKVTVKGQVVADLERLAQAATTRDECWRLRRFTQDVLEWDAELWGVALQTYICKWWELPGQ